MQIIKRKIRSAIWRLQNAIQQASQSTVKFVVELLTERYWLLDYLPTFFKKRQGVLLARLDLIGDFVLWLDSAQAYRRLYPDQKITLAVNSACAELAAALPHWDTVISINVHELRTNYTYRLFTLIRQRWSNYSIAVQPTYSRELAGDILVRSTAAQTRIGYFGNENNISQQKKLISDAWYTRLIANNPICVMELSINAHFIRELGCPDFSSSLPRIPAFTPISNNFNLAKQYIVVSPGASWESRLWPVKNFAHVLHQLINEFDIDLIICGGYGDRLACTELFRLMDSQKVNNLCGRTTLSELTEILRGARLVLTNESAPVHIAAATGTPSVCIVGGGHFGRFLPYVLEKKVDELLPVAIFDELVCFGCQWKCVYPIEGSKAVHCIERISCDAVYKAAHRYLQNL